MADALTPSPLPLRALQRALNKAIELDPATANRLTALDGRRVNLTLNPPGWRLGVVVEGNRVSLSLPDDGDAADLAVQLPPAAIFAQLARAASGQPTAAKGVQVAGDAELASTLFELARHYEPDGSELLTPLLGDVAGYQLAQGLRGAVRFARRSFAHIARNTSEFLREESRDLIAPAEMEQWIAEIDDLRDDVERVEARIARLRQRS